MRSCCRAVVAAVVPAAAAAACARYAVEADASPSREAQTPLQGGVLLAATACAAVAAWRTELLAPAALPALLVRPWAAARGTAGRLRRLFFIFESCLLVSAYIDV